MIKAILITSVLTITFVLYCCAKVGADTDRKFDEMNNSD